MQSTADEEDEVVKEIDVYISQNLANNLSIFQYPLRQPWRKYPMTRLNEIKQKPGHQRVEMSFSPETSTEFYDGDNMVKPPATTLASSVVQLKTNYAIGIFRKDEIHLTPLQSIYQFRPSFAYLDAADEARKLMQKKDEKEEEESAPMDVDDEFKTVAPRPVQLQYRFKESARGAQRPTLAQLRKIEESEPWQIFKFHDFDTEETTQELEKLFDTTRENIVSDVPVNKYLPQLCPMPVDPASRVRLDTSQGITMEILKKLPLERQLSEILGIAQIIHFGKLRELASNAKTELDVLPLIEKLAVMVNGRWIARSNLCCSGPKIIARDYILLLFSQKELVSRKEVQEATGVGSEVARELLSKLSVVVPEKRGWKLKIEPDSDFLDRHPEYADKSEEYWAKNKDDILNKVNDLKQGKYKPAQGGDAFGAAAALPKTIFRGSDEALEQLKKFIRGIFDKYGVCNETLIKANWNVAVKDPGAKLSEIDDTTFSSALADHTMKLQGVYVLKTLNTHHLDKFRDIIIAEFTKKVSMKQSEIREKCRAALKEDIKESDLKTILNKLAFQRGTQWIMKDGTGHQVS
eukprot:Phypoly_transcript_05181.p1 GENE.Phypoly_transcript_05181~~Phypoly_transcript_05181.p1  ORF type:complete len:577 (+),score=111.30 Phypoly_transcript_05181:182-1912(+)